MIKKVLTNKFWRTGTLYNEKYVSDTNSKDMRPKLYQRRDRFLYAHFQNNSIFRLHILRKMLLIIKVLKMSRFRLINSKCGYDITICRLKLIQSNL